ncbi:MAG: ABC-F family ATP-binding cassette domain-containing protein [Chloroflexi bacterium]|nr:ABC-F family ATP-binding cassette domain-containing protein [Chloroflexota bacterium]
MSLISASHLSKSFGAEDIFDDISLSIPQHARIGLVGENGIGKTTLLRMLYGIERPESGSISRTKDLKMGYLPQESRFHSSQTLEQECRAALADVFALQAEIEQISETLRVQPDAQGLVQRLGDLHERFECLGGYTIDSYMLRIVNGLGFDKADLTRPITQFSGGERTRAYLAKLLLMNPELLLLDEPTNHLDIQAMEWLEDFLRKYDGAVMIVSHDRYFLDQTVNTIWEMTPAIEIYPGNYSDFLQQRQERMQRQMKEYESQQEYIAREEDYIQRNIAGQNTAQAKGRRRRLERLLKEGQLVPPVRKHRPMAFGFKDNRRSGDIILRTEDVQIGFKDEHVSLFAMPDVELRRGECVGVIGPNGAGKTTLLRTILGQIPPVQGEIRLGASLDVGYFAQAHEDLHPDWTLMQEIEANAPHMLPADIRNYLGKFLFSGDDVFKPVNVLSGGERGRLALAILALQGVNLIFLDEPTNHLDLPSQEILQAVLADFDGTILLVTHDRYLLEALATHIWMVDPLAGRLQVFKGSYLKFRNARHSSADDTVDEHPHKTSTSTKKPARKINKQKMTELEVRIHSQEQAIAEMEEQLKQPGLDPDEVGKLGERYLFLQKELDDMISAWDEYYEKSDS